MKKVKSIIALLLVAAFAISLSGCQHNKSNSTQETTVFNKENAYTPDAKLELNIRDNFYISFVNYDKKWVIMQRHNDNLMLAIDDDAHFYNKIGEKKWDVYKRVNKQWADKPEKQVTDIDSIILNALSYAVEAIDNINKGLTMKTEASNVLNIACDSYRGDKLSYALDPKNNFVLLCSSPKGKIELREYTRTLTDFYEKMKPAAVYGIEATTVANTETGEETQPTATADAEPKE